MASCSSSDDRIFCSLENCLHPISFRAKVLRLNHLSRPTEREVLSMRLNEKIDWKDFLVVSASPATRNVARASLQHSQKAPACALFFFQTNLFLSPENLDRLVMHDDSFSCRWSIQREEWIFQSCSKVVCGWTFHSSPRPARVNGWWLWSVWSIQESSSSRAYRSVDLRDRPCSSYCTYATRMHDLGPRRNDPPAKMTVTRAVVVRRNGAMMSTGTTSYEYIASIIRHP